MLNFGEYKLVQGKDLHDAIWMALHLHIGDLPQLKGKGMRRDPDLKRNAVNRFADQVIRHLQMSGFVLIKKMPPREHGHGGVYPICEADRLMELGDENAASEPIAAGPAADTATLPFQSPEA